MNAILSWASSQPIWAQVVIGLTIFFVVVPVVLYASFWLLVLLRDIVETIPLALKLGLGVCAISLLLSLPWALWLAAMHVVGIVMPELGLISTLFSQEVATLILLAVLLAPIVYGAWRLHGPLLARLRVRRGVE